MQNRKGSVLAANKLNFNYRGREPVFENLNLSIAAGERITLVGPSGCGKSTFAQIIAGYLRPTSGDVLIDGEPLPHKGFCPVQLIYQHPEKAVNPRWKLRKVLAETGEPPQDLLDKMGVKPQWLDRYPTELSGGELQRFCILRALTPQTRFLIADEISTMLDVITQAQVWSFILAEVERRNIGLLAVTHSLELAEKISTHIIRFEEIC